MSEDDKVDADVSRALAAFDELNTNQKVIVSRVVAVLKTLDDDGALHWLNENRARILDELRAAR